MRTDLPKWLTEDHLRLEGEVRKRHLAADLVDADTERQIAELREVRAAEKC